MTDVAIDRCAEGGSSQCGPQVARARAERGGSCLVVVAPVRNVAPSGLPIHRTGPVDGSTGAGCGDGDGSDVQAAAQPGGCGPGAGGGRRNDDQRHGQPSAAGVSRRSRRPWLNDEAMIGASTSSMRLTVSSPSSWGRSMRSWCQNGFVPLASITASGGSAMKAAAIYARVSSEQQKEENTIASQTAALIDFAREQGYSVPDDWVIEDEGFSGASLLRPGLERLRDLAAEGHIQVVLIHSPDRLSRKYAYQVLLTEEFARHGVETIFLKAPHSGTPEDQLMLQFQGMMPEYDRAQILERSRRGKRHRAKAGEVSVLGGAPYGYRYIRKTSEAPARYQIDAAEAEVVRLVYDKYTAGGLSIGAIARLLRGMGVPTRRRVRWERSVVWAILRNPAYKGTACFNKTQVGPRQKATKPFRLSGRAVHGDKSSSHERPRDEWIEIPVPAIVSAETFALAAERLADNKRFAPRRTIEPSIVQGLVSCRKCRYALARASARTSARKIHYYRCLGSDAWRHLGGPVGGSRPS